MTQGLSYAGLSFANLGEVSLDHSVCHSLHKRSEVIQYVSPINVVFVRNVQRMIIRFNTGDKKLWVWNDQRVDCQNILIKMLINITSKILKVIAKNNEMWKVRLTFLSSRSQYVKFHFSILCLQSVQKCNVGKVLLSCVSVFLQELSSRQFTKMTWLKTYDENLLQNHLPSDGEHLLAVLDLMAIVLLSFMS